LPVASWEECAFRILQLATNNWQLATFLILLRYWAISETLAADGGFEHESALGTGEDADAVVVFGGGGGAGGGGDGGGLGGEGEIAALEIIEGGFVLENDQFAVGLAAELDSDGAL
jgi:hypothetical protein